MASGAAVLGPYRFCLLNQTIGAADATFSPFLIFSSLDLLLDGHVRPLIRIPS